MKEQGFRVSEYRIDLDHEIVQRYQIRTNPTFVYVEAAEEIRRATGRRSSESLKVLMRKPL